MLLKPTFTLTQSEIQDGDIICVQAQISDAEIRQLESQGLSSNPPQLYDYLHSRVTVLFKPKFDDPEVDQPEFSLVLSRKQNYEVVGRGSFIDFALSDFPDYFSLDGFQGWRVPQARPDKTKVHDHFCHNWYTEINGQTFTGPKRRRDGLPFLASPAQKRDSL